MHFYQSLVSDFSLRDLQRDAQVAIELQGNNLLRYIAEWRGGQQTTELDIYIQC